MVLGKLARVAAFKSVAPVAPSPPGKTTRNRVPSSSKVAVVFRGGEGRGEGAKRTVRLPAMRQLRIVIPSERDARMLRLHLSFPLTPTLSPKQIAFASRHRSTQTPRFVWGRGGRSSSSLIVVSSDERVAQQNCSQELELLITSVHVCAWLIS